MVLEDGNFGMEGFSGTWSISGRWLLGAICRYVGARVNLGQVTHAFESCYFFGSGAVCVVGQGLTITVRWLVGSCSFSDSTSITSPVG